MYSRWLARATGSTKCHARAQVARFGGRNRPWRTPTPPARAFAGDLVNDFRENAFFGPLSCDGIPRVKRHGPARICDGNRLDRLWSSWRRFGIPPPRSSDGSRLNVTLCHVSRWPNVVRSTGGVREGWPHWIASPRVSDVHKILLPLVHVFFFIPPHRFLASMLSSSILRCSSLNGKSYRHQFMFLNIKATIGATGV